MSSKDGCDAPSNSQEHQGARVDELLAMVEGVQHDAHTDEGLSERRRIEEAIHDMMPNPKVVMPLAYTRSLDAAYTFARTWLAHWDCIGTFWDCGSAFAYAENLTDGGRIVRHAGHDGAGVELEDWPLTLLSACLRALASQKATQDGAPQHNPEAQSHG